MELGEVKIPYAQLKERISNIPETEEFLREKALLCIVYGSLARVGEVVRGRRTKTESIKASQIEQPEQFPNHIIITLKTEKVRLPRRIPINKAKEPWLVSPILRYVENFQKDEELFPYTTRWAERVFQRHFPEYNQHIHLLRKWRATHLLSGEATGESVPMDVVARMGGWTKLDTLHSVYALITVEDYIHRI